MFQALLHWWLAQLAGLLPPRWRRTGARLPDTVVLRMDRETMVAGVRRRGRLRELGRFTPDRRGAADLDCAVSQDGRRLGVTFAPPSAHVLHKTMTLPVAARRNLGQVLEFELDRETPFRPEDALWSWRIAEVHRDAERMDVELDLIPRSAIAPAAELVEAAGLRIEAVEIDDRHGTTRRIALNGAADGHAAGIARLDLALAGLVAALAIATVAVPLIRLRHAVSDARADVARLRGATQPVLALKRDVERLSSAAATVAGQYDQYRDPIAVLASVTAALPDSTYLTEFTLHGDRATLVGLSPSAARLIEILVKTPPFRDPTFGAPVVRPRGKTLELFTINATVAPTSRK